jgi:hypothetical protein
LELPEFSRDPPASLQAVRGDKMRIIALFISLCALSQAAAAQIPECKSIPNSTQRLACYDKASVAKAPAATSVSKPANVDGSYVDTISDEDARMNARLKSICRGC